MPKKKAAKGTKITLKAAKHATHVTQDGLRSLNLSNMGIANFPKCLFKLTNINKLDLSRNQIQKLPDDIGSLSSLSWLDLHSNKLKAVPDSICNLDRLTHLNLCNNRLTASGLPSALGRLSNLRSLNLGLNLLSGLPRSVEDLHSLQELGLFDNRFTSQPECLQALPNLTKVTMRGNPLPTVHSFERPQDDIMYLIDESSLCDTCANRKCDVIEKRIHSYEGLTVPNSVARVNQDLWRMR